MPTSEALVQPWQAVLWDQLLDNLCLLFGVVMVASGNNGRAGGLAVARLVILE
jgi:hypothetical protein